MNITKEEYNQLANALNDIYWSSIVEETHNDASDYLIDIIKLVEANQEYVQSIRGRDPSFAYRIPSAQQLAENFLNKYKNAIIKQEALHTQLTCNLAIQLILHPSLVHIFCI